MKYYRDFDYSLIVPYPVKKTNCILYDDNIYTFDIETTSVFCSDKVSNFDYKKNPQYYRNCDKKGYMYIWQFGINENVVYGRTWDEFIEFFSALSANVAGVKIIYVHNLAFETQFLLNVITDFEIFARSSRHTLTARTKKYNAEFRCSLMLTNAALKNVPDMYGLPVQKMNGDLDYNVLRNSETPLTEKELKYCEYDCLVVYYLILKFKKQYDHVFNIPLTQTGLLRRKCQKMYENDFVYKKWLDKQLVTDIEILTYILTAFSGGYTHANSYYTGDIIKNVHSKDITSSYPTVMIAEKFPVKPFTAKRINKFDELKENCCYVMDVTFNKIYSTGYNNYLSYSKCVDFDGAVLDNGRVQSAIMLRVIVTSVDIDIIKEVYNYESYTINSCMGAESGYLDTKFVTEILTLYNDKTQFKDLPYKEDNYMQSKQFINAMYGMMVTNLIRDEITFSENKWDIHLLTKSEAQERLNKICANKKTFLSQSWGVFVTAYARRNLWLMIQQIDGDVIYCDTDSVKYINNHEDIFDEYNKKIIEKLQTSCTYHGIDPSMLSPKDTKGVQHPLGVFDTEKDYYKFVTLGAKKYAFQHDKNGKIEITVSGVSKTGASALKKLSDFKKGFLFDYQHSGKKILTYNDEQTPTVITDQFGNSVEYHDKYGINLMPTKYKIGMSELYETYLNTTTHYSEAGF